MTEINENNHALLEEARLQLAKILAETVPFETFIMAPELRSSGRTLAERYAFQIQALTNGLDPEKYYKVSSAHSTMVEIQYGKHPEDIQGKTFQYDMDGKLHEERDIVTLWRLNGLPDYVRSAK